MPTYLEFEKPIAELDSKITELEALAARKDGPSITDELAKLKTKSAKQLKQIYSDLDAWRITQVARHPDRPHFSDFINTIFEDFEELAGDRHFGNDEAIIGGLARFKGRSGVIMGHEKGRTTEKRLWLRCPAPISGRAGNRYQALVVRIFLIFSSLFFSTSNIRWELAALILAVRSDRLAGFSNRSMAPSFMASTPF